MKIEYQRTPAGCPVRECQATLHARGLVLQTEARIKPGERIVVRFELPSGHRVIAAATVGQPGDKEMPVEFYRLDRGDIEQIEAYISGAHVRESPPIERTGHGARLIGEAVLPYRPRHFWW